MLRPTMYATVSWLALAQPTLRAGDQDKAIASIEKMGGTVLHDETRPGKPVVRVVLYCRDLTGFDLKELAAFKGLTSLSLAWSTVTDAELKAVSSLTGLTALDLHATEVTDKGVKELTALKGLTTLNLSGTRVTDVSIKNLAAFKGLNSLKLRNTKVTDAAVAELQKALPRCEVVR